MNLFRCIICNYIYDPEVGDPNNGIAPGTAFEALPASWQCPLSGAGKDNFERIPTLSHNLFSNDIPSQ